MSDQRQAKVPAENLADVLDLSNLVSRPVASALVLLASGRSPAIKRITACLDGAESSGLILEIKQHVCQVATLKQLKGGGTLVE